MKHHFRRAMTACVVRTKRHFEEPLDGWHGDTVVRMQITILCQDFPMTIDDLRHDFSLIDHTPSTEAEIFAWLPFLEQIVWELVECDSARFHTAEIGIDLINTPFSQSHVSG
jgi:hypothetical protein